MSTPEQRARKWLFVYPKDYRERRGEELLATLLDKARDDPRLSGREIRAVLVHGTTMRIRKSRVVTLAVCAALLGAGLGAAIGWSSGPNGYMATTTMLPALISSADKPSPALTQKLRIQASQFATFRRTQVALAVITRHLAAPYPACPISVVDNFGGRGVLLQCFSASAESAQTAIFDQSTAILMMFDREERSSFAQSLARTNLNISTLRAALSIVQQRLATTPPSNPVRGILARELNQRRVALAIEESAALRFAAGAKNPGAIAGGVSGPPTATYGVDVRPIELGAATGLLIGLAIGFGTRRDRRRPARA